MLYTCMVGNSRNNAYRDNLNIVRAYGNEHWTVVHNNNNNCSNICTLQLTRVHMSYAYSQQLRYNNIIGRVSSVKLVLLFTSTWMQCTYNYCILLWAPCLLSFNYNIVVSIHNILWEISFYDYLCSIDYSL